MSPAPAKTASGIGVGSTVGVGVGVPAVSVGVGDGSGEVGEGGDVRSGVGEHDTKAARTPLVARNGFHIDRTPG
jgi:hypothetical protein